MKKKEIIDLIKRYYIMNQSPQSKAEQLAMLQELKDNPLFLEIMVKQVSNEAFHYLAEKLELPESVLQQREDLDRKILSNPQAYPLDMVKTALCDILFHTNPKNAQINIRVLQERAASVPSFNNLYKNMSGIYGPVMEFLNLDPATATPEEISSLLQTIIEQNNQLVAGNTTTYKMTDTLMNYAKTDFTKDLCTTVKDTYTKMFDGITPVLDGKNGEPIGYRLENQTENQRNLVLFVRTDYFSDYMVEEGAYEKHIEHSKQFEGTSYSIISESHTDTYDGRKRITFGYIPSEKCRVVTSTPHDAVTTGQGLEKGIIMKPMYLPPEEIIDSTIKGVHNEIMYDNPEEIKPAMVIVFNDTNPEIIQQSIDIAKAMDIPVVLIDKTYYPEHNPGNPVLITDPENSYEYDTTLKYELEPLSPEIESLDD